MKISIVTPTYNEAQNIEEIYFEIKKQIMDVDCKYEHIIIDNSSTDGTIEIIKKLAKNDPNLKIIINLTLILFYFIIVLAIYIIVTINF